MSLTDFEKSYALNRLRDVENKYRAAAHKVCANYGKEIPASEILKGLKKNAFKLRKDFDEGGIRHLDIEEVFDLGDVPRNHDEVRNAALVQAFSAKVLVAADNLVLGDAHKALSDIRALNAECLDLIKQSEAK